MITDDQQNLIDTLQTWLQAEPDVEAAWLAGSLGSDLGDAFSDVDILVLARDQTAVEVSAVLAAKLEAVARPVLVNKRLEGRVFSVVTEDWVRFDFSIVEAPDLSRYDARRLKPLFNHGAKSPPVQPDEPYRASPERLAALVKEFFRVLGLAGVVVGRGEYVVGLSGVELLRGMTIELMLEENEIPAWKRGGALRRNPLLTPDQRQALEALPPMRADKESLIEGHRSLAALFVPRARHLAATLGMAWPEDLETATRRSLDAKLGSRF
jgi:hypothetical protein